MIHSRKVKPTGRYWSGEMSARSNQDNQREFEERVMKQIIAMVSRKTGTEINGQPNNYQHGGSYVRLESEWRERHRHNRTKMNTNNSNIVQNSSNFVNGVVNNLTNNSGNGVGSSGNNNNICFEKK